MAASVAPTCTVTERPAIVPARVSDPALDGIGPKGAWLALRSLQTMHEQGWARYVAAEDRRTGRHVIDLHGDTGPASYRLLLTLPRFYTASPRPEGTDEAGTPGEAWWYAKAHAVHRGQAARVDALRAERVPKLVTVEETAAQLGLSVAGVQFRLRREQLYPVYVVDAETHRMSRWVFAAQVAADGGGARQVERWREIRAMLPALSRVDTIGETVRLLPAPVPAPIPTSLLPAARTREALAIGHYAGWFEFLGQTASGRYEIALPDGQKWEIPGRAVPVVVLALGDARGEGRRAVFRDEQ